MSDIQKSMEEMRAQLQSGATPVAQPRAKALRPDMKPDDPRARAKQRAAEIRDNIGDLDEGTDKFHIGGLEPDGWTYEWRRKTVLNQEDPGYQINLARRGWEPVPANRHPHMMPDGDKYTTIERDGMILMERPREITDESRRIDDRKAKQQVRIKEEQLSAAPPGQFERSNKDQPMTRIKRSVEPMVVPED